MPNVSDPPKNVPWFSADDQDGVVGDPLLPENNDVPVDDLTRWYDPHQTYDCIYLKDFVSTYKVNFTKIISRISNPSYNGVFFDFVGDGGVVRFFGEDQYIEGKLIKSGVKVRDISENIYEGGGTEFTSGLYNPIATQAWHLYFDRMDYITDIPWAERYSTIILEALMFYGVNTGNTYGIDTTGHSAVDSMYNPYTTVQVPETINIEITETGTLTLSYFYINDLVKKKISVQEGQTFQLDTENIAMYSLVVSGNGASDFNDALSGLEILYDEIKDFTYKYNESLQWVNYSREVQTRIYELKSDTVKTKYGYQTVTRALWYQTGLSGNVAPVKMIALGFNTNEDVLLQTLYTYNLSWNSLGVDENDAYVANELNKGSEISPPDVDVDATFYRESSYITASDNESYFETENDLSYYARAITLIYAQNNSATPNNYAGFKLNPYTGSELDTQDKINSLLGKNVLTDEEYSELQGLIESEVEWLAWSGATIDRVMLEDANPYEENIPWETSWIISRPEDYAFFDKDDWTVNGSYSFTMTEEGKNNFEAQYNSLPPTSTWRQRDDFVVGGTYYGVKVPHIERIKVENREPTSGVNTYTQIPPRAVNNFIIRDILSINTFRRAIDTLNWAWEEKEDEQGNITQELYQDMPDSLRVKEIHLALEAQTYATYVSTKDGKTKPRVANIGYFVKRIANILGITALADGVTYNPLQVTLAAAADDDPETDTVVIPAPYRFNHWGVKEYQVSEQQLKTGVDENGDPEFEDTEAPMEDTHDGLIYTFMSNKFVEDPASGETTAILPTGYALCHNIPQLLRQMLDDIDKGLGIQESAAFAIRSAEDAQTNQGSIFNASYEPKICTYEGLHSLIGEIAYMCSEISRRASGAQLSSMITQAQVSEIMSVIGLPVNPKSFNATVGLEESGGDIQKKIYYAGYNEETPRMYELWTILMQNIAPLLGNHYDLPAEEKERIKAMTPEEFEQYLENIKG